MTRREVPKSVEVVRWRDTHSQAGGWQEFPAVIDQMETPIAQTMGWVLHENEHAVLLSASRFEDWGSVGDVISILKVQIISRHPVQLPKIEEDAA